MKHFLLATLLTTVVVLLYACHKEPPPPPTRVDIIDYTVLPPITQEGKNTFGCKVNGEVWVPRIEAFVPVTDLNCYYFKSNNLLRITAKIVSNKKNEIIDIFLYPNFPEIGNISLGNTSKSTVIYWDNTNNKQYGTIKTDSVENWIDVTFVDTASHIVSGIFQFTLFDDNGSNKSVSITDGRFDLPFTTFQ